MIHTKPIHTKPGKGLQKVFGKFQERSESFEKVFTKFQKSFWKVSKKFLQSFRMVAIFWREFFGGKPLSRENLAVIFGGKILAGNFLAGNFFGRKFFLAGKFWREIFFEPFINFSEIRFRQFIKCFKVGENVG